MLFSSPPLTSPKVSLLRAFSGSAWGIVGELGGPVRSAIGSGIFSRVSSHWRKIVFGTLIASSMFAAHAFDLQGHRGARGLLPENTLAGFDRTLDIGVTTQVYNAGSHIPGYSTVSYPRRAQEVQTWAGFVVTGNVAIAKSTVVTRNEPYMAKRLLIKITQPASATANVYKYSIRAK